MRNFRYSLLISILSLIYAGSGIAGESAAPPVSRSVRSSEQEPANGILVRQWLALQSSGKAAGAPQAVRGQAASNIYQRYLKSFTQPVPEFFYKQSGSGTQ